VGENNVSSDDFLTNDSHPPRDKTETENDTTIFYNHAAQEILTKMMHQIFNHAAQEIPTENDASSSTAPSTPRGWVKIMCRQKIS